MLYQPFSRSWAEYLPEKKGLTAQASERDTVNSPLACMYNIPGMINSPARVSWTVGENSGGGPVTQLPLFGDTLLGNPSPGAGVHAGLRRQACLGRSRCW